MSNVVKVQGFSSFRKLVTRIREDFTAGEQDFVLLYAFNGIGKTRLSMAFKDAGKTKNGGNPDTLYFNAYTEDLFHWNNDLDGDAERRLTFNAASRFFAGLWELEMDNRIRPLLSRYADFDFRIDVENSAVRFSRQISVPKHGEEPTQQLLDNIKVSRGEENLFIWCFFLAIIRLVLDDDGTGPYAWVKHLYIDDPISSLDENNAIAVASDLADLLRQGKDKVKFVVSSHHTLFFNVVCNELKKHRHKRYFLHRGDSHDSFTLQATDSTPFFHHIAMLSELQKAADPSKGKLCTYHFNILRAVMEKTAVFLGRKDFSECIEGIEDEILFARVLNLLSHGQYSLYDPVEMIEDNKVLFRRILDAFLRKHAFALPALLPQRNEPTL